MSTQPDEIQQQSETPLAIENSARPAAPTRGGAVAVIAIVVLVPLIYLWIHHSRSNVAAATTSAPQQAATYDIPALEAAAQSNPTSANRINLSLAYISTGQPVKAEAVLHALLAYEPNNSTALNNLCVSQIQQMELRDAVASCDHAIATAPDFQLAKNNLAWANSVIQSENDALAKQETVAPGARDRDYYLAQGLHHLHLGEYDLAIQSWQKMLLLNAQDAMAANNIGTALMEEHQPKAAEAWFAKATAWDPKMDIAKNNLAWAQSEAGATH